MNIAGAGEVTPANDQPIDTSRMIFVFGSNERGYHGAGAAKFAYHHKGARWTLGFGQSGMSYAIPTKDKGLVSLELDAIKEYVDAFIRHAKANPQDSYQVTCIGCGLAGFANSQIAPMFADAPENCWFDTEWAKYLPGKKFWGTF